MRLSGCFPRAPTYSVVCLALGAALFSTAFVHQGSTDTADASSVLRSIVSAGRLEELRWPDFSDYRPILEAFYTPTNFQFAWIRDGRPTPQAGEVIASSQKADLPGSTRKTTTPPAGLSVSGASPRRPRPIRHTST